MGYVPPSVFVLYQYLYPDDVVSSLHVTQLCEGLVDRGWRVTASSCNRACRSNDVYPRKTIWNGIEFLRVWRPGFRQSSGLGRTINAIWMLLAWSLMALNPRHRPDVLIIGTDPVLSPVVALAWRFFKPRTKIVHWCFDLYPEAAIAGGVISESSAFVRLIRFLVGKAYRCCNLIVDIGDCMRQRLQSYGSSADFQTIAPWALTEPQRVAPMDAVERKILFGEANLGLLYSGTFGHAHTSHMIPELAEALERGGGRITFSAGGNAFDRLQETVRESGARINFVPPASSSALEARLAAADVHIVTLREGWTGTVVPSKFFGALAVGRPVLFIGSTESAIARWIEEFQVGWVLRQETFESVVTRLLVFSSNDNARRAMFQRCQKVYRERFSRAHALDSWDGALRGLISSATEGAELEKTAVAR